tara:strand:+ start:501 stop:1022 length:522 start_codon:yes stop_codon:yes gene_type:complete
MERVILVDEQDNQIGTEEKLDAHQKGALHRCFSIFIFNSKGELLLQQRAQEKYHSGGIWASSCCSHQREKETTIDAAHRRLQEEFGFDCELKESFTFTYKASFPNGLTEHEFDHVLLGTFDDTPKPNKEEIMDWKWVNVQQLQEDIVAHPNLYAPWLKIALPEVLAKKAEKTL